MEPVKIVPIAIRESFHQEIKAHALRLGKPIKTMVEDALRHYIIHGAALEDLRRLAGLCNKTETEMLCELAESWEQNGGDQGLVTWNYKPWKTFRFNWDGMADQAGPSV